MNCKKCNQHILICEINESGNYNVCCKTCGYKYEEGITMSHAWENVYISKIKSLEDSLKTALRELGK